MANLLNRLRDSLQLQSERYRNRPFLEATMAAAALVAFADGSVSISERYGVDQLLEHLDRLKAFDPHEAVDLFNSYVEELRDSPEAGRDKVLAAIAVMAEDPETAKLVVRVSAAISRVDGTFTDVEREQIHAICGVLGLAPEECEV